MSIGQELLNVPMGDMIRQMAFAIADGQTALDAASIDSAEMMGGLTTVYDAEGNVTFDDSRVFFGYEYMTYDEAVAYIAADDAFTGALNSEEIIKLSDLIDLDEFDGQDEIRVPVRHSMLELGFAPTFYQFVDTIIEVKIAIKITRTREYGHSTSRTTRRNTRSESGGGVFSWLTGSESRKGSTVTTSQVDASYSSKYSYSAEGSSILRTKIAPVPPPTVLEDRIRSFMETEEAKRRALLEAESDDTDTDPVPPPA